MTIIRPKRIIASLCTDPREDPPITKETCRIGLGQSEGRAKVVRERARPISIRRPGTDNDAKGKNSSPTSYATVPRAPSRYICQLVRLVSARWPFPGALLRVRGGETDQSNETQNGEPLAGMREAGSLVLGGGIRGARLDSEPIVLPRKAPAHTANG